MSRSSGTITGGKTALVEATLTVATLTEATLPEATLAVQEPAIDKALTPGLERAPTPSKWDDDDDEEMEDATEIGNDPRELEAKLRQKAMESLRRRK